MTWEVDSSLPRAASNECIRRAELDLGHFAARVIQDALTEAEAAGWERRARAFEEAAPRSTDFNGRATPAELEERSRRCLAVAAACRHKAELIREGQPQAIDQDVWAVVEKVA